MYNRIDCEREADKIRERYNPENLVPFPYQTVADALPDLEITIISLQDNDDGSFGSISGATVYSKDENSFTIIINSNKPQTRQNFTIAHELGHYFLHKDYLITNGIIMDDDKDKKILYRADEGVRSQIETEADNFAAALLMPADLVKNTWSRIPDVQSCAKIFEVSVLAMSIRLERLGLIV